MNKNQKIILFGALFVFLGLVALIIVLISQNATHDRQAQQMEQRADSLRAINDSLELQNLTSEFDRLNAEFDRYEDRELNIKNDSLVKQYNEAKERVSQLINELDREKKANNANRDKIKKLEAEISTLKDIAKHYLEEIRRLSEENEGLRKDLASEKERNESLVRENTSVSESNAQLSQTVKLAKKLNITGLSLTAYNKKDKSEKNVTKAKKLGVSFTVSPNNTAAPGNKTFYVRILSPEGSLLGGGVSCSYDGGSVACTAARTLEYDNGELPVSVYWDVNTTLSKGDYTVEVFCDGYRLGSRRVSLQ